MLLLLSIRNILHICLASATFPRFMLPRIVFCKLGTGVLISILGVIVGCGSRLQGKVPAIMIHTHLTGTVHGSVVLVRGVQYTPLFTRWSKSPPVVSKLMCLPD